jgi:hypothetical protein
MPLLPTESANEQVVYEFTTPRIPRGYTQRRTFVRRATRAVASSDDESQGTVVGEEVLQRVLNPSFNKLK